MGASCTITSTCGLAQEARQYTNNEDFINSLVSLSKTSQFKRAAEEANKIRRSGTELTVVTYHKDGSPTYRSMMAILNLENKLAKSNLNTIDENTLQSVSDTTETKNSWFDVKTIFKNKLLPIARQRDKRCSSSEKNQSVSKLNERDAREIVTTFNLQNAANIENTGYIAIYEREGLLSNKYRVKLVKNTTENRETLLKQAPAYATIQAGVQFFEQFGITVHLDQFDPKYAGTEYQIYDEQKQEDREKEAAKNGQQLDDMAIALSTVIALCTNLNENDIADLPQQINRNIAVMAANVIMEIAEKNPEFRESVGYQRLQAAVQRYINTTGDKQTVDKLMRSLLADEIQDRININLKRHSNSEKSLNRLLNYTRQRVRSFFDRMREFFTSKQDLIDRWKQQEYQNKKISLKKLQREVSQSVNEMFQRKDNIKKATENVERDGQKPNHRQNLKRYTNQELKEQKKRHNNTQKLLLNIEGKIKTHLKLLVGQKYTKESTRFENMVDDLNNAFNATNAVGSVTSQKDVASKSLTRVAIQLNYELQQLDNDINALHQKIQTMVPDYTDEEYMECVQQLQMLYSRFQTLCDIKSEIVKGLDNGLLNPKVVRLGTNGIEESNLKAMVDELSTPMVSMKESFESIIDKVNLDLLEQMVGSDEMNMVIGKMFNIRRQGRGHTHELYKEELEKKLKPSGGYYKTRELLKEQLEHPENLRNSLWHRIIGSPQNSSSILNQIAWLAISRANTEAHNRTQQTMYDIINARRLYSGAQRAIIERDINGIPTGNLVRPIDYTRYEEELNRAEKQWGEEFAQKYKNKDYTRDQMAILWKSFRQEKFNEWNKWENPVTHKPDLKYKKQKIEIMDPHTGETKTVNIYAPNPELYKNYANDKSDNSKPKPSPSSTTRWDNLTEEQQQLSNFFFALKYYSDDKLDGQGSGCHKIPMFKGGMFDTFWGNNITHLNTLANNTIKRSFLEDIEDNEYGAPKLYSPLSQMGHRDDDIDDKIKRIPLYGVRKLDNMDALSTDLYSSYLAYEDMSNNYAAKSKVELLLQTTATKAYKSVRENDSDRIAEKTHFWEGHTFRHEFEHMIDKEIYGLKKDDFLLGGIGIRLAKVMNWIGRITTGLFLGGNIHSSFVNLVTGYNEIVKEAGVGEYINKRDLIRAMYNYTHHVQFKKLYLFGDKNTPGFMPYLLRQPAEAPSLVNQILRDFDFTERFVQDIRQYSTKFGNKIMRNFNAQRLIMLPYEVTDHWMQAVPLMAMLHHEKVYSRPDENGKHKQITLMEALYPEYHKFGKKDKTETVKNRRTNTEREVISKKGWRSLVEKPNYINTGNRFGIFYKTEQDAIEGEELLKLIEDLTNSINNHYTNGGTLRDYKSESPESIKVFEKYGLSVPTNIKQFEAAKSELTKKFNNLIYNNAELSKFQLKAREVVNRMHGVYDSRSKGAFNRHLLGATMLSMKNYAVGLINKRLMQGHYNIILNKWDEGTYVTVAKVIIEGVAKGWREYGAQNNFGCLAALILPYIGKNSLRDKGFTESQITNLKRAKMDALRALFWGMLNHIIYGLGSGWIGGWDDDDDEKAITDGDLTAFEKMLGLEGGTLKITRKSIESGEAFEKDGPLYSQVSLRETYEALGVDMDDIENHPERIPHNNSQELDFIKERIIPHLDDIFESYGGSNSVNAWVDNQFTEWCNEDPEHRYFKKSDGTEQRGWGGGKGHSIFPSQFEKTLKDKWGTGEGKSKKLPKTTMQQLADRTKDIKKEMDAKVAQFETMATPSVWATTLNYIGTSWIGRKAGLSGLRYTAEELQQAQAKDRLQSEIVSLQNTLSAVSYVKHGYNKHIAQLQLPQYEERKKELLNRFGVATIEQLRAHTMTTSNNISDQDAAKELRRFLEDYTKTKNKLASAEKAFRNKDFEQDYFKTNHPNAYYWLGVANYIAERALIEQESFIPFADLLARKGGGSMVNTLVSTASNTDWITKVIPELAHCEPIEPLGYKFNAFNEMANLISLPAATGSLTSVSNTFSELGHYIFNDEKDYNNQIQSLVTLRDRTKDEMEKEDIQHEIDDLTADWEKHHVQNNSAKLKKGEHKASKAQSFIPYWRTLYLMGFFNYMDGTSLEGGWQATNSFKSFFYKEDKL